VAHRENVDRVRGEQHGRFGGAGVGTGKVSGNNLCDIKFKKKINCTLLLISAPFKKFAWSDLGSLKNPILQLQ